MFSFHLEVINQIVGTMIAYQGLKTNDIENKDLLGSTDTAWLTRESSKTGNESTSKTHGPFAGVLGIPSTNTQNAKSWPNKWLGQSVRNEKLRKDKTILRHARSSCHVTSTKHEIKMTWHGRV